MFHFYKKGFLPLFVHRFKATVKSKVIFNSFSAIIVIDDKNIYFVNKRSTGSVAHRSILDIRVHFTLDTSKDLASGYELYPYQ